MPVKTYSYNLVQGVRQLVVPASTEPQEVSIHNHEHSQNREVFIGNSQVTADNGMHAVAAQTSVIHLEPGDDLYAITENASGVNLRIMTVTKR